MKNYTTGIDPSLRTRLNKDFIVRLINSVGKVELVGIGQLHKKLGTRGIQRAYMMADFVTWRNEPLTTFKLKSGVTVTFTKRK